eukprot:13998578-Ditylum_brightwellii.AAC.1
MRCCCGTLSSLTHPRLAHVGGIMGVGVDGRSQHGILCHAPQSGVKKGCATLHNLGHLRVPCASNGNVTSNRHLPEESHVADEQCKAKASKGVP